VLRDRPRLGPLFFEAGPPTPLRSQSQRFFYCRPRRRAWGQPVKDSRPKPKASSRGSRALGASLREKTRRRLPREVGGYSSVHYTLARATNTAPPFTAGKKSPHSFVGHLIAPSRSTGAQALATCAVTDKGKIETSRLFSAGVAPCRSAKLRASVRSSSRSVNMKYAGIFRHNYRRGFEILPPNGASWADGR